MIFITCRVLGAPPFIDTVWARGELTPLDAGVEDALGQQFVLLALNACPVAWGILVGSKKEPLSLKGMGANRRLSI